jgi:muramoyltetrapeptide carboxypeptidase
VVLGKLVNRRMNYLSAPDEARADELNAMLNDDSIDAILCGRGGYGVMRMLPMVDFEAIRRNPKAVIGYSDITALVNAIYSLTGVAAFHGPVASSAFDAFTLKHFPSVLFSKKAAGTAEESSEFQEISIESSRASTIVHGVGRGRLVGGNLTLVTATLGTPYEIDTTGALLFLEEVSEEPYRIDRMLTQLWLAGKLQSCKAIAIGQFKNTEARRDPTFDVSYSLREVLETRFKPLGIPTVYGLPIGHIRSKLTVPIGVLAELDATAGRLTLLEPAVG